MPLWINQRAELTQFFISVETQIKKSFVNSFAQFWCPPLPLAWERTLSFHLTRSAKVCLGRKLLSGWDWKQIRLQFDCCYCPIKLTVNSSLSDVLSNSRREKFFSKKRFLHFPAFAFVILCKYSKSTNPAPVEIKGGSFSLLHILINVLIILKSIKIIIEVLVLSKNILICKSFVSCNYIILSRAFE